MRSVPFLLRTSPRFISRAKSGVLSIMLNRSRQAMIAALRLFGAFFFLGLDVSLQPRPYPFATNDAVFSADSRWHSRDIGIAAREDKQAFGVLSG